MKAKLSLNKTVIALSLFLLAGVINLVVYLVQRGWETHANAAYPVFLALYLVLVLVLLIRAIVKQRS